MARNATRVQVEKVARAIRATGRGAEIGENWDGKRWVIFTFDAIDTSEAIARIPGLLVEPINSEVLGIYPI